MVNPHLETPRVFDKEYHHKNVSMISKLRVSSHNLQIEMGRRAGTQKKDRKCHCGEIEDEQHFLVQCNKYIDIRSKHKVSRNTEISKILDSTDYIQYITELYKRRTENDE